MPLEGLLKKNTLSTHLAACKTTLGFVRAFRRFGARTESDEDAEMVEESITTGILEESFNSQQLANDEDDQGETEQDRIRQLYVGLRDIPISELREPGKDCRVRAINEGTVKSLKTDFIERGTTNLASHLTVLQTHESPATYTVIDGNHRLRAMKEIRDLEGQTARFTTITCRVYKGLNTTQALGLGYMRNREAGNVYRMTDYEVVCNLRKIFRQLEKEGIEENDKQLERVYDLLNATSVSTPARCI